MNIKYSIKIIYILFFSILILEVMLRISFIILKNVGIFKLITYSINLDKNFNYYDTYLGVKQKPNIELKFEHPEFNYTVRTVDILGDKTIGFRDDGIDKGYVYAIAVGDSFCWGYGVDQDFIWNEILENKLNKDIINMGFLTYGPQQCKRLIEKYVPITKSKLVFFCFNIGDIYDANVFEQWENSIWRYFNTSKDIGGGRLFGIRNLLKRFFLTYNIYSYLKNIYFPYKKGFQIKNLGSISLVDPNYMYRYLDFSKKDVQNWWAICQKSILRAKEICDENKCRFIFLYIPTKEEVYIDLIKQEFKVNDMFLNQGFNNVMNFIKKNKIDYLELLTPIREKVKKGDILYFQHDGHWNKEGNKFVAEYIYKFLKNIF